MPLKAGGAGKAIKPCCFIHGEDVTKTILISKMISPVWGSYNRNVTTMDYPRSLRSFRPGFKSRHGHVTLHMLQVLKN